MAIQIKKAVKNWWFYWGNVVLTVFLFVSIFSVVVWVLSGVSS